VLLVSSVGDLFASWYAYPDEEHVDAVIVLTRKLKGSSSWETPRPCFPRSNYSAGNPVLFETPTGRIGMFFVLLKGSYWTDAVLYLAYSDDAGQTWSRSVQVCFVPGMMVRHGPVALADGTLLLPAYDERSNRTVLFRSASPYTSWMEAFRFDEPLIQPSLVRSVDDRLSLYFRPTDAPRQIWRSHSIDSGRAWSTPIRTPLPNPLSGIDAFDAGGMSAVVYNHTELHQRHPLSIAVSPDGGTTWSAPWHIDEVPVEVSYPSFACHDGVIHGTYTYNRRMIKYVTFPSSHLLEKVQ
jgi:predicted neuraminidase